MPRWPSLRVALKLKWQLMWEDDVTPFERYFESLEHKTALIPVDDKLGIPVVVMVSDCAIYFCPPLNDVTSHSLLDLLKCKTDNSVLLMEFSDGTYEFRIDEGSNAVSDLVRAIALVIVRICPPHEYPEFSRYLVKKSESLPFKLFMRRFKAKLRQHHRGIDRVVLRKLKRYIDTCPAMFEADVFPELDDFFDILLDTFVIEPSIVGLRVGRDPHNRKWRLLAEGLWKSRHIRSLKALIPPGDGFDLFVEKWKEQKHNHLHVFCFANTVLRRDVMECMRGLFDNGRIACFALEKCDLAQHCDDILCELIGGSESKLRAVIFSTMFLDRHFAVVESMFRRLQVITLKAAHIELCVLLAVLMQSNVQVCDISGCLSTQQIGSDIVFPTSLRRIAVNHVEWTPENLVRILKLAGSRKDFSVALGSAKMDESKWKATGDLLESMDPGELGSLIWRRNPVGEKLTKFVMKAKFLRFLSLAGCELRVDPKKLGNHLRNHPNLVAIDVRGIGKKSLKLIKALSTSSLLERLDISNNQIGKDDLHVILSLIANLKAGAELLIYHNGLGDEATITAMASAIAARGSEKPIFVSKPIKVTNTNKKQLSVFCENTNRDPKIPCHEDWKALVAQDYRDEDPLEQPTEQMLVELHKDQEPDVCDDLIDLRPEIENDAVVNDRAPSPDAPADIIEEGADPHPAPVDLMKQPNPWQLNTSEPPDVIVDQKAFKAKFSFQDCLDALQGSV